MVDSIALLFLWVIEGHRVKTGDSFDLFLTPLDQTINLCHILPQKGRAFDFAPPPFRAYKFSSKSERYFFDNTSSHKFQLFC